MEEGTDADEVEAVEALSRDDGDELGFAEEGHFGGRERTGAGEGSGGCHCGWVGGLGGAQRLSGPRAWRVRVRVAGICRHQLSQSRDTDRIWSDSRPDIADIYRHMHIYARLPPGISE